MKRIKNLSLFGKGVAIFKINQASDGKHKKDSSCSQQNTYLNAGKILFTTFRDSVDVFKTFNFSGRFSDSQ